MKRRYKTLLCALTIAGAAAVMICLSIDPLLDVAGDFLLVNDEPQKSDLIVVPAGESIRFIKAASLLKAGFADRIIINLEKSSPEVKAFERRYGTRFSGQAVIEHIMKVDGLTPLQVIIPDKRPVSTKEDFLIFREYLEKESPESIIVVTSWYHVRRCRLAAKRFLSKNVKIYFVSANMPDMRYFISRSKRATGLFNAYVKLLYYYVTTF